MEEVMWGGESEKRWLEVKKAGVREREKGKNEGDSLSAVQSSFCFLCNPLNVFLRIN